MQDYIQIALLGDDFKDIIQFDRQYPSKGITVFILKDNSTPKQAQHDKKLTESLKQLRRYCELVSVRLKILAIDFSIHENYYDIIFEFIKYFLDELPETDNFKLNMGDDGSPLNLALLNAADFVTTYYSAKIIMHITVSQNGEPLSFNYTVQGSRDLNLDLTIDKKILESIAEKAIIKEIADELQISIGSVSNRFHQFKEKGLITINGHERALTDYGEFILKVLTYTGE